MSDTPGQAANGTSRPPEDPPAASPTHDADHSQRYDANLNLILRRLADERRTPRPKPWWKR